MNTIEQNPYTEYVKKFSEEELDKVLGLMAKDRVMMKNQGFERAAEMDGWLIDAILNETNRRRNQVNA